MSDMYHRKLQHSAPKSQSAMEYLMTYGWAILIIAVVLGALYYLGVFNTANLAPRAQPGSCKVIRPSGPGTTTFVNLAGVCTGQLPLFVGSFDGQSSYVQLTGASAAVRVFPSNAITLYAWVYPTNLLCGGSGNLKDIITEDWQSANKGYELGLYQQNVGASTPANALAFRYNSNAINWNYAVYAMSGLTTNHWYQVAATYDGANINFYQNGALLGTVAASGNIIASTAYPIIGAYTSMATYFFGGNIANVQIYNTSLSAIEVQGLYAEGIGGAPTRLQNLVGWWPLNGDAKDYSGNGNSGVATNVIFTSTWTK